MSDPTARIRLDIVDSVLLHTALSYYKKRPEAPEGEWERITDLQERIARATHRIEQGVEVPA